MSCKSQVTTKSGTFTFHDQLLSYCKAKKFCASEGEILAPITNKENLEALKKVTRQSCFKGKTMRWNTGLDIEVCNGVEVKKVFTNGVNWNEKLHGPLYEETYYAHLTNMRNAIFRGPTVADKVDIMGDMSCRGRVETFICLKPASESNPEKLVKGSGVHSFNSLALLAFVVPTVAFFCAAFVATKLYKQLQSLEAVKEDEMV